MKKLIAGWGADPPIEAGAYAVLNTDSIQRSSGPHEENRTQAENQDAVPEVDAGALYRAPAPPTHSDPLPYAAGTVVDQQGRPIPGVAILNRGHEKIGRGETQEQGFEFHTALGNPTAVQTRQGTSPSPSRCRSRSRSSSSRKASLCRRCAMSLRIPPAIRIFGSC